MPGAARHAFTGRLVPRERESMNVPASGATAVATTVSTSWACRRIDQRLISGRVVPTRNRSGYPVVNGDLRALTRVPES